MNASREVARILQQNSAKLPENYRREFEELKEKEAISPLALSQFRLSTQSARACDQNDGSEIQQRNQTNSPPSNTSPCSERLSKHRGINSECRAGIEKPRRNAA